MITYMARTSSAACAPIFSTAAILPRPAKSCLCTAIPMLTGWRRSLKPSLWMSSNCRKIKECSCGFPAGSAVFCKASEAVKKNGLVVQCCNWNDLC
ncbi:hypothetical protein DSY3559 [Desulfitobacterium hafniense Y51]|uniref:Secreted protein n=1 Tax=Desulfitobacterium hafniense (strain Y51) TaxID=138119 RepID=Q24RJ4_DESHY|nr:hypothetical protein DSY3559 [Desulfitobacterium hafniense Y51]